ncbi:MAG TPA: POTRA domain-containing protein [Bacteroidota bacterium]|nr:POTRA domain-containing protein [Bacteroidota bacterium]
MSLTPDVPSRRTALLAAGFILLSCGHAHLRAQQEAQTPTHASLGIIDTVIVSGNEKTEAYVILDEMTLKSGMAATPELLEYDRNRIYSLGLFTSVDLYYDSLGTKRFLLVNVRERWFIVPVPILGFRDGDPSKFFFGGGLLHYNFRGRNQKLFGSAVFGYDPAFAFSFSDPQYDRADNLFLGASISASKVRNKSVIQSDLTGDFDEQHYDVNGTIGKRLNLFESAGINAGFHAVNIGSLYPGRTVSPDGRDRYIYATASYVYDSRNLLEYATQGSMFFLYFTKYGFGESNVSFSRYGLDARKYFPLGGDFSLAARVQGSLVSGGLVPTYAHVYFGIGEHIRGYYRTIWEGEDIAGGTLELRYALLGAKTIRFSAIPLPDEFSVWRFGVSLALFTDTGLAWFRGDKVHFDSFASGYGGGVHFLLPYGVILRTEYAWNDHRIGQFIIDFRGAI